MNNKSRYKTATINLKWRNEHLIVRLKHVKIVNKASKTVKILIGLVGLTNHNGQVKCGGVAENQVKMI